MINETKVKKVELLIKVKKNRIIHEEIYNEAMKGWEKAYRKALETELAKTEFKNVMVFSDKPTNFLKEYDGAIMQLEMSVDAEITLRSHEFQTLCLDQWQHDRIFTTSTRSFVNMSNLSGGAAELYNSKLASY